MSEVSWERLKAHELRALAAQNAAVIVPLASIEQHGPHLPTMTDTRIGREVAFRAAHKAYATRPVLVTPVVWSGLSEHHMTFGGTITLTPATFHALVHDIVASLVRLGFRDVLLSNSHGGNHIAMQHAAESLAMELDAQIVATTYVFEAAEEIAALLEDQGGIQHACEGETAMMLALEPALVDAANLSGISVPGKGPHVRAGRTSYRWRPFAAVTPNGLIGDPARATPEKGEALLEAASDAIAALLTDAAIWKPAQ